MSILKHINRLSIINNLFPHSNWFHRLSWKASIREFIHNNWLVCYNNRLIFINQTHQSITRLPVCNLGSSINWRLIAINWYVLVESTNWLRTILLQLWAQQPTGALQQSTNVHQSNPPIDYDLLCAQICTHFHQSIDAHMTRKSASYTWVFSIRTMSMPFFMFFAR